MPRYFFGGTNAGDVPRDQVGTELADDGEARDEAVGLLPDIAREELPDGDRHEFVATVRNAAGAVVSEANLTLHGRWWPGRRSRRSPRIRPVKAVGRGRADRPPGA